MDKNSKSFLLTSSIFAGAIFLILVFFAWTIKNGSIETYEYLTLIIIFCLAIILATLMISVLAMMLVYFGMVKNGPVVIIASFGLKVFVKAFEILANLMKLDKNKIRGFYIDLNNRIVGTKKYKLDSSKILIILPHCVQNNECHLKVTGDIALCKKCGKCDLKDCLEMCQEFGINAIVATGGTLARKAIKDLKPKFIISVACERDLAAGIADVSGIPVIGILNTRPNGPCFNTNFDVALLRTQIEKVLK